MCPQKSLQFSLDPLVLYRQIKRPVDWYKQFPQKRPLDVEIGSGLGEYIVRLAQQNPARNFIGIELEWKRIKKILRKISVQKKTLGSARFVDNIRVLQIDASVAFERLFRPKTIRHISCLFPCPWPRKKHIKHRLFSRDFLRLLNSRLEDAGQVHVVTDYRPYFDWMLEQARYTGFQKRQKVIAPRFDTKFEKKWQEMGQNEFYELQLTKNKHVVVPLKEDAPLKTYFVDKFDPQRFVFKSIKGAVPVVLKEFLFDQQHNKGMAHMIVCEGSLTQHVWVSVDKTPKGWRITKAEGQVVLPTQGVAKAIDAVYRAVKGAV